MKPNLFTWATSELSQDAFLCWLIQWADESHSHHDTALHETAKDFVRLLIGENESYNISKVETGRQWRNIDVWVKVNEKHFIAIEDKVNTREHSNQLERYKQTVIDAHKGYESVFVYLKTGNESDATLDEVKGKGYKVINRKAIIDVLNKRGADNHILSDFKTYLEDLEALANSFLQFEDICNEEAAAQGFYVKLQSIIKPRWSDWRYVPNRSGGFWGFWYYWQGTDEIREIYIQIENRLWNNIKLIIKVSGWEPSVDTLYRVLGEIKPYAEKNGLEIDKPDKYKAGDTSTLAVIQDAFEVDGNGQLNLEAFVEMLGKLEKTIDEYCSDKSEGMLLKQA